MEAVAAKKYLTPDDVAGVQDIEYAEVEGWDGTIRIQSLNAGDLIEWSEANEGEAKRTAGLRLIVKSWVDGDGKRLAQDRHIVMLRTKSHKITERIVEKILQLNDMKIKGRDNTKKD